jgi:SAM-dependent methyltransferase
MSISFNKQETVEKLAEKDSLFPLEEAIFKEYLSPPGRIFDLGCGPGRASGPLKDMGHQVVGVDVDPDLVEQARKLHLDIEFSVGNATELEFEDEVLDSVHFSLNGLDRLYPMQNRMDALSEIHRVLRPGGTFIYISHDRNSLFDPVLRRGMPIKYYDGPYHTEGSRVTFYGTLKNNLSQQRKVGFNGFIALPQEGASWRYYVTWKKGIALGQHS